MDEYIIVNDKKLRLGYTTGTCATIASSASTWMLLHHEELKEYSVITPKGMKVTVLIEDIKRNDDEVSCCVTKDGGDDPDATHGAKIYATVRKNNKNEIIIDGKEGVGRVTLPGLDQPIGASAINSTPRITIKENVLRICEEASYFGGLDIMISVPNGEKIAEKTFNPKLGIVGGISIIGTTGIVTPMSEEAILETVKTELRVLYLQNNNKVILTPGNYGEKYLKNTENLMIPNLVMCSNFIGDSLTYASNLGFKEILLVGHIGKLIKVAGGMMNTHSKYGDNRLVVFKDCAKAQGVKEETLLKLDNAVMTDDMIDIISKDNKKDEVMYEILSRIEKNLEKKVQGSIDLHVLMFSNKQGCLAKSKKVDSFLKEYEVGK